MTATLFCLVHTLEKTEIGLAFKLQEVDDKCYCNSSIQSLCFQQWDLGGNSMAGRRYWVTTCKIFYN